MRNLLLYATFVFCLTLIFSCKQKETAQAAAKPVPMESRTIQQTKGTDCDKEESLRKDCAQIDFTVPKLKHAESAVGKSVTAWADKFLIRLLTWTDYDEAGKGPKTVDAAIQRFRAIHDESEGSVSSGAFAADCPHNEMLNAGTYLTQQLTGSVFLAGTGGEALYAGIGHFGR